MDFTKDQSKAANLIKDWFYSDRNLFVLGGFAGTGKSYLISKISSFIGKKDFNIVYATLTGKASLVLREKNIPATTIHKLIYRVDETSKILRFIKVSEISPKPDLIVIDEFSMVNKDIFDDLMSFGIKVLMVGDPFQLPPIGDKVDLLSKPDFVLTEIVRQALDSGIIKIATSIRYGGRLKDGSVGKDVLIRKRTQVPDKVYLNADQIISPTNISRNEINNKVRSLKGFKDTLPMVGDKLICCKNEWDNLVDGLPVINGCVGECVKFVYRDAKTSFLGFRPDYSSNSGIFKVDTGYFTIGKALHKEGRISHFEFGYCITCHKSQGSEWNNVLVIADYIPFEMKNRWLYTAVTRAKSGLVIAI